MSSDTKIKELKELDEELVLMALTSDYIDNHVIKSPCRTLALTGELWVQYKTFWPEIHNAPILPLIHRLLHQLIYLPYLLSNW